MAGSVNKVILIGNLGRDPEVRTAQSGNKIVNLSVATAESWRDKHSGERKEKTEWHRVVIFNDKLADVAEKWLAKGSKVYIEGQLQTRKWKGNDGVEKYTTEVVVPAFGGSIQILSDGKGGRDDGGSSGSGGAGRDWSGGGGESGGSKDLDDEIPFIIIGDFDEKAVL